MNLITTEIKGRKALQHTLLLECPDLFHAHFLNDTASNEIENLFHLPVYEVDQKHTALVIEAPFNGIADALFTRRENTPLLIKHADCQAAIFWDPINKIVANVHAGWRGLVQEIYTETLNTLLAQGSKPENLLVGIGPALNPCHSEFKGWETYFPPHFEAFQVKENYFNLKEVAKSELLKKGILPHHLSISQACTACDPACFHSWRGSKSLQRLVTVAQINTQFKSFLPVA